MSVPYLTLIVFLPVLGMALIATIPGSRHDAIRKMTLAVTIAHFALSLPLWWLYQTTGAPYQLVERRPWITTFGIDYHLGADGVSVPLDENGLVREATQRLRRGRQRLSGVVAELVPVEREGIAGEIHGDHRAAVHPEQTPDAGRARAVGEFHL